MSRLNRRCCSAVEFPYSRDRYCHFGWGGPCWHRVLITPISQLKKGFWWRVWKRFPLVSPSSEKALYEMKPSAIQEWFIHRLIYCITHHCTTDQMELRVQAQVLWLWHHKSSLLFHSKFLGIWPILEGFVVASLVEAPGNVGVLPAYWWWPIFFGGLGGNFSF